MKQLCLATVICLKRLLGITLLLGTIFVGIEYQLPILAFFDKVPGLGRLAFSVIILVDVLLIVFLLLGKSMGKDYIKFPHLIDEFKEYFERKRNR